ncbi:MAG: hypothetical protein ACYC91_16970 [Solirubrobacteraceae bacterium]
MSERGNQLLDTADRQISELTGLVSTCDEAALRLPCPGREKLGDGTIGACALHTSDNYHRIAGFVGGHSGGDGIGRFLHGRDVGKPHGDYGAENLDVQALLDRLSTGRSALGVLADLTDEQLDAVPPASDMKFCDGQRTLEQVVTSMLNHQNHQVDALKAATA